MLEFRRILAFSTRIHNYVFVLYILFVLLFLLSLFSGIEFDYRENLVQVLTDVLSVLGWTMVFEGLWIILSSLYHFFYTKVFAIAPVVSTLIRMSLYLLIATIIDSLSLMLTKGLTI